MIATNDNFNTLHHSAVLTTELYPTVYSKEKQDVYKSLNNET